MFASRLSVISVIVLVVALSLQANAKAEFVPDPSTPPRTTFGSGTR